MSGLMRNHPNELEAALWIVNDNLTRYALNSLERGAAGIFLSVPASGESVALEEYERFMRPYDLALLQALHGRGEFHIAHVHGSRLHFDRVLDYPVHAVSWADREAGPSLAEARRRTGLPFVGGIAQTSFPHVRPAVIREQVRRAHAEVGRRKLLLAPGCSLPTSSPVALIRAARDAAATV